MVNLKRQNPQSFGANLATLLERKQTFDEALNGTAFNTVERLRLADMRLCRPRQWGACWLAGQLWQALRLDRFWADRLTPSRKGTQ